MPEFSFFEPDVWTDAQAEMFDASFPNPSLASDPTVEALFFAGYLDMGIDTERRAAARDGLAEYLSNVYGVIFDEIFDWQAWKEMYNQGMI